LGQCCVQHKCYDSPHLYETSDPFAVQAPDAVEAILENASASCARFNSGKGLFVGQYLAIGRLDGTVVVCNVETKDALRCLEGHVKSVSSVW
jgi:COMPASS component SWD1